MRNRLFHILLFAITGFLWSGCRKDLPVLVKPEAVVPTSMTDVFDAYWQGMNQSYVFWDVDTTNWDRVYTQYRPLFAKLSMTDTADQRKARTYFEEMSDGLCDGHYYIQLTNPYVRDTHYVYPQRIRNIFLVTYIDSTYFNTIVWNNYLNDAVSCNINFTLNGQNKFLHMITGIINPGITYLRFSEFRLTLVAAQYPSEFYPVWNAFLSNAMNVTKTPNGMILDLRSNGGGATVDLDFVAGNFIDKPLVFAQTHLKSGPGRLDHSPWMDAVVTPAPGAKAYNRPIVVLVDRHSASMAEVTAMAFRSLPGIKVTIVGDTTYGATGPMNPNVDFYNGGQFNFAKFGYVRTSSAAYRYNGTSYEGQGYPPDVYIPFVYAPGLDADCQLDEAIRLLK